MSANINQFLATEPNVSAKVSANAGTGKTFVLTSRVLRLLLSGVHPSKILCLTYTKAAATEMYERITREMKSWATVTSPKLAELLGKDPTEEELKRARKLFAITLESVPPPRIQTIHSFCAETLKRFPLEAGINPNFNVLDDLKQTQLLAEAKTRLFLKEHKRTEVGAALDFLAANISESVFTDFLREIIAKRNTFKNLFENIGSLPLLPDLAQIKQEFVAKVQPLKLAAMFASSKNKTDIEKANWLMTEDFEKISSVFLTATGTPRAKIATNDVLKQFPELMQILPELLAERLQIFDIQNQIISRHVYFLAYGLCEIYDNLKQQISALDYNDLLFITRKLLSEKSAAAWVLYKLDGGIDHILVDEAQDTSPEQWEIIRAITDNFFAGESSNLSQRTFFAVGDEKQSIYGFQGAEPANFAAYTGAIKEQVLAVEQPWKDVGLKTSYRSVSAVLGLVDKIFGSEHIVHRQGQGGRVELWDVVERDAKPEHENWHFPEQYFDNENENLKLADKIAGTIKSWLDSGRILPSKGRAVAAGDILILLQRRGSLADYLIKKLKTNGIAVSGSDRLKLTEHIAVQDLLALAKFTLLPEDDLNLACLLKSPLFGVAEDDLFSFCHGRAASLWAAVAPHMPQLLQLQTKAEELGIYEFYSYVLDVLDGRKKIITRLGQEATEVIDEFLDLALSFEQNYTGGLQGFVQAMQKSNSEIKRDLEQGAGQVRVMTVHGAKGLQAPIVFLADAGHTSRSAQDRIYFDDEFIWANHASDEMGVNLQRLKELQQNKEDEESRRLLYVALTRAEDELYICAAKGSKNLGDDCWYFQIKAAMDVPVIETPQNAAVAREELRSQNATLQILPEYLERKYPYKQQERKKHFESDETREGKKIHKILELAKTHQNPQLAEIFEHGLPEVGIAGIVGGEFRQGRIDRLLIKPTEVWIVDFKTTESPPATVPSGYISQLNFYGKMLASIYAGKNIRKFILWTATNGLVEV